MNSLNIIVLGYIVRGPVGGMVTSNLQYLQGLMRLGHNVYFIEIGDHYASCYDPSIQSTTTNPQYGISFAKSALTEISFGDRWAYYDPHSSCWLGPCGNYINEIISSADLVLNLCGVNPISPFFDNIPVRVLIDQDPGFTQIKHKTDPDQFGKASEHTKFFSFGELICSGNSKVPSDGFNWKPTRPPICLDLWRSSSEPQSPPRFTSVMQWKSYKSCEYDGITYGMKDMSFIEFLDLPSYLPYQRLEMAVAGARNEILDELKAYGWSLVDPAHISLTPKSYKQYIWGSQGEFGVSKHGYVIGRTGWFSERSACYLASGRPVICQDTGFSQFLPCGIGLQSFTSLEDAITAFHNYISDPVKHKKAAFEIAEDSFESSKVLGLLIDEIYSDA